MGTLWRVYCTAGDVEQNEALGRGFRGGNYALTACRTCGTVDSVSRETEDHEAVTRCPTCANAVEVFDLSANGRDEVKLGACPRPGCSGSLRAHGAGLWD